MAGIDVGAYGVKAVVFDGTTVLGRRQLVTEEEADAAARGVLQALLAELGTAADQVQAIAATGWGRRQVSSASKRSSELLCAVRGARWLVPTAGAIVDIGAESCRAMKLRPDGSVDQFAENSKCAAGTGAFIELAATYLKVPVEQIGPLALAADGRAEISSVCAVFAESAIISLIHRRESVERIAAAIVWSAATRVAELVKRVGGTKDLVVVGGGALNPGLIRAIEENVGVPVVVPDQPQYVVALGAAIQAQPKTTDGRGAPSGRGT
ncbi:MAG: acyl-CoA dehydratase activase [Chloroflexi bacterium]|nr:acyl-CoA dehydratase activase [Chloroflexota bacterium]